MAFFLQLLGFQFFLPTFLHCFLEPEHGGFAFKSHMEPKRFAIISDIHGNLEALTRALEVIDEERVDDIVCLGDTVGYGANPVECLKLVRSRCSIILLGNHDAASIDLAVANHFTLNAQLSAIWTFGTLEEENKAFLRSLKPTHTLGEALLSHGSPYEPDEWHYVISEFDIREAFGGFTERICFVGHSHIPIIFSEQGEKDEIARQGRFIVNVGSIGQPRDGNPNLSFGIFDREQWSYRNLRVEYDFRMAAKKIRDAGLPRALADRLAVGA
jgi:predicted phosphodiesterase